MKRSLLPMKALGVLDVTARHLSFEAAAEELAVTPSAVRKRIRALEYQLGTTLVRCAKGRFELTEEAIQALPALRDGLGKFNQSVQAMKKDAADRSA